MKIVYVVIGVHYNETGRSACDVLLVTTNPDLVEPERERVRALKEYDNVIFEEHELIK